MWKLLSIGSLGERIVTTSLVQLGVNFFVCLRAAYGTSQMLSLTIAAFTVIVLPAHFKLLCLTQTFVTHKPFSSMAVTTSLLLVPDTGYIRCGLVSGLQVPCVCIWWQDSQDLGGCHCTLAAVAQLPVCVSGRPFCSSRASAWRHSAVTQTTSSVATSILNQIWSSQDQWVPPPSPHTHTHTHVHVRTSLISPQYLLIDSSAQNFC